MGNKPKNLCVMPWLGCVTTLTVCFYIAASPTCYILTVSVNNLLEHIHMRLKKVTQIDPIARLAISARQSTLSRLEAYQAHYEKTYGEPIERSHLVEQVLLDYMNGDKAFVKGQGDKASAQPPAQP